MPTLKKFSTSVRIYCLVAPNQPLLLNFHLLSLVELEHVLRTGEIIERDEHAKPYPKCIFLGYTESKGEALHVVCSVTPQATVVTVYFPDEDRWAQDRIRIIKSKRKR